MNLESACGFARDFQAGFEDSLNQLDTMHEDSAPDATTADDAAPPAGPGAACPASRPLREYLPFEVFANNLPYLIMAGLGAGILLAGLGTTAWGYAAAGLYVLYCLAGAVWIMVFVCPSCGFYGTRSCPCGYGQFAAWLRPKSAEDRFAEQFRKHIPVIVPLWFIPLVAGTVFLILDFTASMAWLVALFTTNSFLILPWVARKYGCAHCPQKESCPWMTQSRAKHGVKEAQ